MLLPALYGCHSLLLALLRIAWPEFWLCRFCIIPQLQHLPLSHSLILALHAFALCLCRRLLSPFRALLPPSTPSAIHHRFTIRAALVAPAIPPANFSTRASAVARTRPPGRALSFFNQTTKASVVVKIGPLHRLSRRPRSSPHVVHPCAAGSRYLDVDPGRLSTLFALGFKCGSEPTTTIRVALIPPHFVIRRTGPTTPISPCLLLTA